MSTFDCLTDRLAFAEPSELARVQTELLNAHLDYCRLNSPFYAALPTRKITLEELAALPTTTKNDLASRNDEFAAVAPGQLADICFTSGTTGRPCRIAYTAHDLERLAYNDAVGFHSAGIRPGDRVLLTCTLDRCFIAGLAYYSGCVKLGASAIRNGLNSLEAHAEVFRHLRPEAMVGVPSFLVKFGEYLRANGIDGGSIRTIVCIGEPLRTADLTLTPLGRRLEQVWPGCAYSTYASSEIATSFTECCGRAGGHAPADLAIVEILDEDGAVLPPGETGEVTVTPLGVTGMPLVRFRTGDLSYLITNKCVCGRNSVRLGPILGRKSQMLKIKGTTLFPNVFFSVLDELPEISEYFLTATGEALSDMVEVTVAGHGPELDLEHIGELLQAKTRIRVMVRQIGADEVKSKVFGRSRKATRFFDLRARED